MRLRKERENQFTTGHRGDYLGNAYHEQVDERLKTGEWSLEITNYSFGTLGHNFSEGGLD